VNPIQGARTGIGIHRFYFSSLPASANTADIQAVRNKQKEHIKSYLEEMNVSSQLLDAMEATPPEAMRMLKVKELASFGLAGRDPVYDEKTVAEGAASVGVSSSEYRKRTVEAKAYCQKLFDKRRGTVDLDLLLACEPNYVKAGRGNK